MSKTHSQGKIPTLGQVEEVPRVGIHFNARFIFKVRPGRWLVFAGALIPMLSKLVLKPGLNGVDKNGQPHHAVVNAAKEGSILIPHDVQGKGTSYLRVHDGLGGKVWLSKFERPHTGSAHISTDQDGHRDFCLWLVEQGIVPGPTEETINRLEGAARKRLKQLTGKAQANPALLHRVEEVKADLAVIAAARKQWLEGDEVEGEVPDIIEPVVKPPAVKKPAPKKPAAKPRVRKSRAKKPPAKPPATKPATKPAATTTTLRGKKKAAETGE